MPFCSITAYSTRKTAALLLILLVVWLVSPTSTQIQASRTTLPADFYQVIVTNNLFRPLGWVKPKPKPAFKLIVTVMKSNGKHKALIRSTPHRKLYYVAVGEPAGDRKGAKSYEC